MRTFLSGHSPPWWTRVALWVSIRSTVDVSVWPFALRASKRSLWRARSSSGSARHSLAQLYSLTFQRLKPMVLQTGALSTAELDRLLATMTADDFRGLSNSLFSARGRKVAA